MILDINVATLAHSLATVTGPGDGADALCDLYDPELDGSHIITHCYSLGHDLTLVQLLDTFVRLPSVEDTERGLVVLNRSGRAGITTGYGFVVEPAGGRYSVTTPEPSRWLACYQPPQLLRTSTVQAVA